MIFLVGEQVHSQAEPLGNRHCGVCGLSRAFSHVIETNFFTFFGMRLFPIEKFANYWRCDHCASAYLEGQTNLPSQLEPIQLVLAYMQMGYGMSEHVDLLKDIYIKVCDFELSDDTLRQLRYKLELGDLDVNKFLQGAASGLNLKGKQQILEAGFLMAYASCEIEYEDRLRINLMGSALGVSLEFVNAVIEKVHSQGCYGVRRMLPTQTQIS